MDREQPQDIRCLCGYWSILLKRNLTSTTVYQYVSKYLMPVQNRPHPKGLLEEILEIVLLVFKVVVFVHYQTSFTATGHFPPCTLFTCFSYHAPQVRNNAIIDEVELMNAAKHSRMGFFTSRGHKHIYIMTFTKKNKRNMKNCHPFLKCPVEKDMLNFCFSPQNSLFVSLRSKNVLNASALSFSYPLFSSLQRFLTK